MMALGRLVPDTLVLDVLATRIGEPDCARGSILDGFPRTLRLYNMAHFALPYLMKTRGSIVNIHRSRRNARICVIERCNIGSHPRIGCGTAGLRHPRERGYSRRGNDSAVPTVARHIRRSRTETSVRPVQDPSGKENDLSRRDRGNGSFPAFLRVPASDQPACVRGWRLRTPWSSVNLKI
jgi:adenylate kinase family enzyme